jgi:hypothetical protein
MKELELNAMIHFRSLITSGSDGRMTTWNVGDGSAAIVDGEGHNCQVRSTLFLDMPEENGTKVGGRNGVLSLKYLTVHLSVQLSGNQWAKIFNINLLCRWLFFVFGNLHTYMSIVLGKKNLSGHS